MGCGLGYVEMQVLWFCSNLLVDEIMNVVRNIYVNVSFVCITCVTVFHAPIS